MHKQAMDVSLAVSRAGVVYLLEVGSFTNCDMIHTVQKNLYYRFSLIN